MRLRKWMPLLFFSLAQTLLSTGCTRIFSTEVDSSQQVNEAEGNFSTTLTNDDQFGAALTNLGDLDNDGVTDVVAGMPFADDGGTDRGAVWILFMDDNGQVDVSSKISASEGNLTGPLDDNDQFGSSVAQLGDLNGDGFLDIAVGAPGDDEAGTDRGAVYILFLKANGSVQSETKIAFDVGGFDGSLDDNDRFGSSIANIGDLNNDGVIDLAVGVALDDDGGPNRGAVYILFMNSDGTVAAQQKISREEGSFQGNLFDNDLFGSSVTSLGDIDGDGVQDLAVGASGDDSGGSERGAVWILFMSPNGIVEAEQKISQIDGLFDGSLADGDEFGNAVTNLGDFNSDGVNDLVVGAKYSDDGGTDRGAIWILFLDSDGKVVSSSKISDSLGNFTGDLADDDQFGYALASIGDLNNDGNIDLVVSAPGDDGPGVDHGSLWVLFMANVELGVRADKDADLASLFSGSR